MENAYRSAADKILECCGGAKIAIVLGSGLGDYASELEDKKSIPYREIPGFPESTVQGHAGVWHSGTLSGKRVYMMQGRFHAYEGYALDKVTFPIRVMKALGVETVILTNAAGGVNLDFSAGDLMLITDFINLTGHNPLTGPNNDEFGPRFPDMSEAFDKELRQKALDAARDLGVKLQTGIYCWLNGPNYETPAEIRMVRLLGADAIGMSTVPEVVVARHCGMRVLGISCITNMAAGVSKTPLVHEEVMEVGRRAQVYFRKLVGGIVGRL